MSTWPETERALYKSVTVPAPAHDVWWAWTSDAGLRCWLLDDSHVELRVGGPYEFYFDADGPTGQRGSEGCQILGIQAPTMLTFTWNAPPHLADVRTERTVVLLRLHPDERDEATHVQLIHVGWGDGGQWDEAFAYFDAAWDRVCQRLHDYFARQSSPAQD